MAHHRRANEEALFKRPHDLPFLIEVPRVVRIHDDVGAGLDLVADADLRVDEVGAGFPGADIPK